MGPTFTFTAGMNETDIVNLKKKVAFVRKGDNQNYNSVTKGVFEDFREQKRKTMMALLITKGIEWT